MYTIDSHIHLWRAADPHRIWVRDKIGFLQRDRTIDDFAGDAVADGVIVVEAAETLAETLELCAAAASSPLIRGVVGWLDLAAGDALETLDDLCRLPMLRGIRLLPAFDRTWRLTRRLAAGLRLLADRNLTLDVLATPEQLAGVRAMKDAAPDLRIMLNHGGRPLVMCGMRGGWRDGVRRLGRETDVRCKLSGLVERAGFEWSAETLRPFVEELLEAFGPARLAFASNWPMLEAAATQRGWHATVEALLDATGLSAAEKADVFHGTAVRAYRLDRPSAG
jgi:L-fuconolactonase